MNKTHPRMLLGSFTSARANFSTKPSSPSHYETLEINSRATQGEIKSAYFKLSKQYHPDRNSSVEATDKFRNISEAYEILGNYDSRKSYDRSIITRTRYNERQQGDKNNDPNMKYYQAQAAVYRDAQKVGSSPLYDFDAWTKAHYGRTLRRTLRDREEGAKRRAEKMEYHSVGRNDSRDITLLGVAFILFSGILLSIANESAYDETAQLRREKRDFKEKQFFKSKS